MTDDNSTRAPVSITEQLETFVREDGSTYTRKDIFVKLYVTFRDAMLATLKGPRLSVYLCIALHCGEDMTSYPSLNTISRETGYGRRAVINAVNDLVTMNLIERRYRKTEKGDPDSNLYTVKGYIGMGGSASNALPGAPGAPGVVHLGIPKEEPLEEGNDNDDGRAAATPLPKVIIEQDRLEAMWSLIYLGVDPDVAKDEARRCDPGLVVAWCASLQSASADNLPGLLLSKLRTDPLIMPMVFEESVVGFLEKMRRAVPGMVERLDYHNRREILSPSFHSENPALPPAAFDEEG